MTRSSNGLSMSGVGFTGNFWRKQTRGHGPKSPWQAYVPVSERYFVKRYIGTYHPGPKVLGEPEYCFKFLGVYRLPELIQMISSKELGELDFIQQEDDVGWENPSEFLRRVMPRKSRSSGRPSVKKKRGKSSGKSSKKKSARKKVTSFKPLKAKSRKKPRRSK